MKKILALIALIPLAVLAGNDLIITWTPNAASESNQLYRVYLSTNATAFVLAGAVAAPSFTISNVAPGTYGASITASNLWGESARSAPVYTAGPILLPSVPTGVTIFIRSVP